MDDGLLAVAEAAKGFMPRQEGLTLYRAGLQAGTVGPLLEIGSYCGKSAVYLGAAARAGGTVLVTVDHHRGSEEHQPGEGYHDRELVDPYTGCLDTLPALRRTLHDAGLDDVVVAVVADSVTAASLCRDRLGMVFLDGSHTPASAIADYEAWMPHLAPGGMLAIHDVFSDPREGGQAPFGIYRRARQRDGFEEVAATGSLRVLRRPSS